jgi:heme/copper-type cytochrome/quinol oxidase subunit 2
MLSKQKVFMMIFLIAALLIAFTPLPVQAQPVERKIRIEAGDYAFSPAVIHANPGDRVTIELVSKDVVHGLSIDGYSDINLQSEPGKTARATFIAERAGTFKIRCSVACGNLHPFMTGKISIGPNLLLYRAVGLALLVLVFGAIQSSQMHGVSH